MGELVSVVMSVYNGEKYLRKSIESILNQTYSNFEFIIIDDGSKDRSLSIIKKYKKMDNRIIVIENKLNLGLIESLNRGIKRANGKYIIRMDADDIAIRNRIQKQVYFMDMNSDLALSGTSSVLFIDKKPFIKKRLEIKTLYQEIISRSFFECAFVHPTVIIRKEIIENNEFFYKQEFKDAEDFGLWSEIIPKYKVANINEPLLKYRIVRNSITRMANKNMTKRAAVLKKIYFNYIKNYGLHLSDMELDIHFEISMIQNLNNLKFTLKEKQMYLEKICSQLQKVSIGKECAYQFLKCCIYQGKYEDFKNSNFNNIITLNKYQYFKIYYIEKAKRKIKKID